ncbi:lipase family protein [Spirosoma arboris]|uniref:lipase family protein n=1 Tax=Spirosoma arboris TaxID=2682092 RepID=UPI001D117A6A|nr:lipase family protein [Spirosoma arboris]
MIYQPADYQVSINRISYQTTLYDGTPITASGIVYLPSQLTETKKAYPLLSFQHPTAYSNAEAPSGTNFASPSFSYPLYFATHGYIVACPDYIGYGITDKIPHDYEYRQSLANATVDMLLATKEFLAQKSLTWAGKVFLAGYSEGGYATLSAQKLLENTYSTEFQLAGSSCGAGPYAMPAFFDYLTKKQTSGGVANYLYIWEVLSYDRIYALNKPISYYFKSPYAEQITQSIDNARSITASFDQLCTDQFKADVLNPSSSFRKALNDNDLTNWSTQTPTQLIHSQQDEIIPFLTSLQTYTAMKQQGSSKLSLVALATGFHVPTEVIFMRRSLNWFEQLKNK